ncbi:MAG TPA: uroporphyrinogen decarboxylase family protein [Armatimonadota bacterium]|nr:uroporphyrinogen decarboxylase family protein [Armatimonadota bacterium]
MPESPIADGIHAMVPREQMVEHARRLRDTYAMVPGIRLVRREFGFYCLERWKRDGMPQDVPLAELFDYDPPGFHPLGQLGWCEAAFVPSFETRVLEDRGAHEVVQDYAGRHVLYFKGRRDGFMPEYLEHPVRDQRTWEEDVKWRMDPTSSERYADLEERMAAARQAAGQGYMIQQNLIGGYMYLRSLMGPEGTLYAVHDMPEVVHDCMQTWFRLADTVIARHQEHVTLDELYLAEDICYNHGLLISPAMMREFLIPYYQQLIANIKARQIDRSRHLYVQIDTDGFAPPAIPVYRAIGMDAMSPFEVAAGCDVVQIARQYPDLVMFGGIDKRVMAQGPAAIDEYLQHVIPPMRARGGYIPTCDHGVPEEVSYENYLHYRKRCVELGG